MYPESRLAMRLGLRVLGALAIATTLLGCGESGNRATQLAASVDSEEISVRQVNVAVDRLGDRVPGGEVEARRRALEGLVEQQLFAAQAVAAGLDRSPLVMRQLDEGRRDILSRAYLETMAAAATQPDEQEVRDFYLGHPELFAQRRIYSVHQVVTAPHALPADRVRRVVAAGSLDQFAAWLESEGVAFRAGLATYPAEDVPLEFLPVLHRMADGQTGVFVSGSAMSVIRIIASRIEPIAEADALSRSAKYLANANVVAVVARDLERLKRQASIRYRNEFAPDPAARVATREAPLWAAGPGRR